MQPILFVACDIEGLIYINGRLAGETGPESPLSAPIAPAGTIYLEYRPLYPGYLSLSRRLTLAGGCGEVGEGISVLSWPSGVTEVEIQPERLPAPAAAGMPLPAYALEPDDMRSLDCTLCVGPCRNGGRYAAALDPGGRLLLEARGDESYFTQNGDMRLFRRENDVVGHARLLTYRIQDGELLLADVENMWVPGGPVWPDSPEKTALAAAEAAILGLWDEADGYLLPEKREACLPILRQCADFHCAAPMRFPMPDGRAAVALCRRTGPRAGEALPLYYHAVPSGGIQGPWRIDRLSR